MPNKKLIILHSNDLHGDFQPEFIQDNGYYEGGLSLLSGYINKVRNENENVFYFISGDMVQGSLIDSEFQAISTIELMNYLSPDAITLGNHEFGYGLTHLLFLEKLANFPIINANLYIEKYNKRLMQCHLVIEKCGIKILVIGVITDEALERINKEARIAKFITIKDAAEEIGKICNAYHTDDINLTVVLSHIGIDEDRKLALNLRPEWGVDLILGGHSHTYHERPEKINNIMITHAGKGTDQIGKYEIAFDDSTNKIINYSWELIPITCSISDYDLELQIFLDGFQKQIDDKYNAIVCKLVEPIKHHKREAETALGNLIADILQKRANTDLALVGSASIRRKTLGHAVTLGDLKTIYPYDEKLMSISLTGNQIYRIFSHFLRKENRHADGDFYQVSNTVCAIYDIYNDLLLELLINGEKVDFNTVYSVCIEEYHYLNLENKFPFAKDELKGVKGRTIASSCFDILLEYFSTHQNLKSKIEGRLIDASFREPKTNQ